MLGVSRGREQGETREATSCCSPTGPSSARRLALKHPDGAISRNPRDKPWTTGRLDRHCTVMSGKLGFRVTPYMVRHTFATRKIIEGVDLVTIATLMGHVDLKMLMRIYQHVRQTREAPAKGPGGVSGGKSGAGG